MAEARRATILCLASYEKGNDFIEECKRQGARVLLLTTEKLLQAPWPCHALDGLSWVPDMYDRAAVIAHGSALARGEEIDAERFVHDLLAVQPAPDKPTS